MMFTEAITSMFTKQVCSANKGVNDNKFLYTVNSNLQDCIYSIYIMSHLPPELNSVPICSEV